MSTVETNLVQPSTGTTLTLGASGDTVDVPSGATLDVTGATVSGLSAGKVLQVVSTSYNGSDSTTSNSFSNTGLAQAITPSATSSKVLILCSISYGGAQDGRPGFCIKRGSTELNLGSATDPSASGSRKLITTGWDAGIAGSMFSGSIVYLDSPSTTSATTYTLAFMTRNSYNPAVYLNRTASDTDNTSHARGASTIVLMEIEG
jgi:hypothetical protein